MFAMPDRYGATRECFGTGSSSIRARHGRKKLRYHTATATGDVMTTAAQEAYYRLVLLQMPTCFRKIGIS